MPAPTTRLRAARLGVLLASALAISLMVPAAHQSASAVMPPTRAGKAAITVKVSPRLFGLHDRYLTSLSSTSTGSIRLWDAGTTWPTIQPTPSTWNWAPLDTAVRAAHDNGTEVTLVLGLSPSYAAATSTGAPDLALYSSYLRTVMQRYSAANWGYRGIAAYQVWNEANITTFWTGTRDELAELTKAAYDVRNQVDPGALIIAPAMVTRLKFEQKGIQAFYTSLVPSTRKPVWRYVDAVSLNLYPTQSIALGNGRTRTSTPEDSIVLLNLVRGLLAKAKVPASLPIWNTEVNYGMGAGVAATPISMDLQVAYVMRTFLLNAAQGVKRVDWYAYDMGVIPGGGTLGNTLLTDPTDRPAGIRTPAGVAFQRVQSWMAGTLVGTPTQRPCIRDRKGTYTCTIRYAHSMGRVYWNPYAVRAVTLARSATKKVDEYGVTTAVRGGSKLKVGVKPVLVRSRK